MTEIKQHFTLRQYSKIVTIIPTLFTQDQYIFRILASQLLRKKPQRSTTAHQPKKREKKMILYFFPLPKFWPSSEVPWNKRIATQYAPLLSEPLLRFVIRMGEAVFLDKHQRVEGYRELAFLRSFLTGLSKIYANILGTFGQWCSMYLRSALHYLIVGELSSYTVLYYK